MIKPSLEKYCQTQGVDIDLRFGLSYSEGDEKDPIKEMQGLVDSLLHRPKIA
jgi:hypothetical protein